MKRKITILLVGMFLFALSASAQLPPPPPIKSANATFWQTVKYYFDLEVWAIRYNHPAPKPPPPAPLPIE